MRISHDCSVVNSGGGASACFVINKSLEVKHGLVGHFAPNAVFAFIAGFGLQVRGISLRGGGVAGL